MNEPSETAGIDTLIISMDDGTVFRCSPVAFGGPNAPYPIGERLRWQLDRLTAPPRDEERAAYSFVGPRIEADRSPEAVMALIQDWWNSKRSLGQANENAATMRARLVNEMQHGDHDRHAGDNA